MSQEIGDVQSDGDCEELVDESFRFTEDCLEKKSGLKRTARPPSSPKSPYLTSLNMNPRRAAVAAWRLPRASLGGSREGTPGERDAGPGRPVSLSNGHDLSPMIRADCAVSPELFQKTFRKQHRLLQSAANGFAASDFRDKEDMYQEIIHLKKSLQAHKSDNRQMKAKLRRLEEDNAKRERQIEELLDPTKGADFARSLVDNRRGGSVVVNGLKQRILKLEQQFREKESALSKLQSDLRTTSLEELKIAVETYLEEIQRLKMLLVAAEKRCVAESKSWQRQQKALNSTVQRLSERASLLQKENQRLSEELSTVPPTAGLAGYKDWSKKRLLRRVLELERRLEDKRRPAPSEKRGMRLDRGVQTSASDMPDSTQPLAMATEARISVATMTAEAEEESALRGRLSQWERERAELQEALREREGELAQVRTEREKCEKEMEELKAEQTSERDTERQQHKHEMEVLWTKLQTLEEERERAALTALETPQDRREVDSKQLRGQEASERDTRRRERAARVIQRQWREHRDRDVVVLQSALRGHLHRHAQLKAAERTQYSDGDHQTNGLLDLNSLILIQSALRGHLARSGGALHSSGVWESSGVRGPLDVFAHTRDGAGLGKDTADTKHGEDAVGPGRVPPSPRANLHKDEAAAGDSDDSDDIIMSPSRPIRRREVPVM
uniref:IQ domain-containing protein E n=1 Tax=Neogobius melanostomus TaxID=47308 RepID=A0A8C6SLF6_9GOBI